MSVFAGRLGRVGVSGRMATLRARLENFKRAHKVTKGITLIELIAVAVILGVFALIVVPNVVSSLGLSKNASFQTTLSEVQSASDQFYAVNNVYPTYSGAYSTATANQPVKVTSASQLNPAAQDLNDTNAFQPSYIRTTPSSSAANQGLNVANGASVYYGVVASGQVFATQTVPTTGQWSTATTNVFDVQNTSTPVALSTIW